MEIDALVARGLQVLLALGGAYLIATWFVLIVWTFRDIESRSKNVVTQVFSTLLAVFFWVPGVLLYMLLRPKETLDEAYQRSLEEEYLLQDLQELPLCPNCNHFIHDDWQICPHCNTQLRAPCDSCGQLVDLRWDICPYCGTEQHERVPARLDPEQQQAALEGWVDPEAIERRLRLEAARNHRHDPADSQATLESVPPVSLPEAAAGPEPAAVAAPPSASEPTVSPASGSPEPPTGA